jgi:thiol-disulfide isomerase/thioredoxin
MGPRRVCGFLLAAVVILSSQVTESFGLVMSMRTVGSSSSDNLGSKLPRSNNIRKGPNVRLPSTANEAVAVGVSAEAYDGPGLRSRIYDGIKKRIDRKKKKVEDISDIHELQSMIANEHESFIAVMFHAPFCKSCQASIPLFHRMARKYSNVKFLSVPLTEYNKDKLKGMGVEKFPFGHIYDPERGLVDELPTLRKLMSRFEDRLRALVTGEPNQEDQSSS